MSLSISTVGDGNLDSELVISFMLFTAPVPTLNPRPGYKYLLRFTPFCDGITRVGGGVLVTLVLWGGGGGVGGGGGTGTGTGTDVISGEVLAVVAVVWVFITGRNTCLEGPVLVILPGLPLAKAPLLVLVAGCVVATGCGTFDAPGPDPTAGMGPPLFGEVLGLAAPILGVNLDG